MLLNLFHQLNPREYHQFNPRNTESINHILASLTKVSFNENEPDLFQTDKFLGIH